MGGGLLFNLPYSDIRFWGNFRGELSVILNASMPLTLYN